MSLRLQETLLPSMSAGTKIIAGRPVRITHPERLYFPEAGITKGHILSYYLEIAPLLIPYLHERPLTLERFPQGVEADSFYQKDASPFFPDWIRTFPVTYPRAGKTDHHPIVENAADLVYLTNLGTITFHAFLARLDDLDHPDLLILDIDPPDSPITSREKAFEPAKETALLLRAALRALGLDPKVKTSGKRGLHLGLALDRTLTYVEVRKMLTELFRTLTEKRPDLVTVAQRKKKRQGKVYLDALRMAFGATVVPPYSVRATSAATVSMPISWDDLTRIPHSQVFTVRNAFSWLEKAGDLWHGLIETPPDPRATLRFASKDVGANPSG